MPKRSSDFNKPTWSSLRSSLHGKEYYSSDAIDQIIEAAGGLPNAPMKRKSFREGSGANVEIEVDRRTALKERLENAARVWDGNAQDQSRPRPRQLADSFAKIERAADRLLHMLQIDEKSNLPTVLRDELVEMADLKAASSGESGGGPLESAIAGVWYFKKKAAALKAEWRAVKTVGRPLNFELLNFVRSLCITWVQIFERRVATGYDHDRKSATGPMVRFVMAAVEPLGIRLTENAARDRIRWMQGLLREIIAAIPDLDPGELYAPRPRKEDMGKTNARSSRKSHSFQTPRKL